jgi:hypothetical protein
MQPLRAIRTSASGKIKLMGDSRKHVAWSKLRDGIYMQTPLVYGDLLYACRDNGVLSCYEVETGKRLYRKRLGGGGFTASPVAANGRLYFTGEDGEIFIVRAGREFELLAQNSMNEVCMATPAISDGMLIIRTKNHLYAVGNPRPAPPLAAASSMPLVSAPSMPLRLTPRADCCCQRATCQRPCHRLCGWRR